MILSPTDLGVDSALPEAGLVLVEDDGDGVQLLIGEWGHHQLLVDVRGRGQGHHGPRQCCLLLMLVLILPN